MIHYTKVNGIISQPSCNSETSFPFISVELQDQRINCLSMGDEMLQRQTQDCVNVLSSLVHLVVKFKLHSQTVVINACLFSTTLISTLFLKRNAKINEMNIVC